MIIFKNGCAQSRWIDHFCCCCCCLHRMIRIMRCGIVQMKTFACRFATGRPEIIQRIVTILRWTSVDRLAKNTKRERENNYRTLLSNKCFTNRSVDSDARSRCRRFLNQLETCVVVKPVTSASSRFSLGDGYGL